MRQTWGHCGMYCFHIATTCGRSIRAATDLRRLASALSDPGSVAPPTMKFLAGSSEPGPLIMLPNGAPTTRTTLSTAGCATSGKNVANRNSSLGSPLRHVQ